MKERLASLFRKVIPKNPEDKLKFRQITSNFSWLLVDKLLRYGLNLGIGVWIAIYLGPQNYGLLNNAIAIVSILAAFSTLGLDQIIIRDLVLNPAKKEVILGSGFILRIAGSLFTVLISFITVVILRADDSLSHLLVVVIAAGSLFQAFDIIDFWFQSKLQSKYTVIAKNTAFIVVSGVRAIFILTNCSLEFFAYAILIEYMLGAAGLLIAYKQSDNYIFKWNFDLETAKGQLKNSWPLVFTGIAVMLYMRIDQVMISELVSSAETGIYSAAVKLAEAWYFIPIAFVNSVFPVIVETKKVNEELYYRRLSKLYAAVTWGGLTVAIFVSIFADLIVSILGGEYKGSGSILSLTIWAGVFVFQGVARSAWLISENLQKYSYYYTFGAAIINIILNFYMIPAMGGKGAAIATIISYFCSVILIPLFIKQTRRSSIQLLRSFIWR